MTLFQPPTFGPQSNHMCKFKREFDSPLEAPGYVRLFLLIFLRFRHDSRFLLVRSKDAAWALPIRDHDCQGSQLLAVGCLPSHQVQRATFPTHPTCSPDNQDQRRSTPATHGPASGQANYSRRWYAYREPTWPPTEGWPGEANVPSHEDFDQAPVSLPSCNRKGAHGQLPNQGVAFDCPAGSSGYGIQGVRATVRMCADPSRSGGSSAVLQAHASRPSVAVGQVHLQRREVV